MDDSMERNDECDEENVQQQLDTTKRKDDWA